MPSAIASENVNPISQLPALCCIMKFIRNKRGTEDTWLHTQGKTDHGLSIILVNASYLLLWHHLELCRATILHPLWLSFKVLEFQFSACRVRGVNGPPWIQPTQVWVISAPQRFNHWKIFKHCYWMLNKLHWANYKGGMSKPKQEFPFHNVFMKDSLGRKLCWCSLFPSYERHLHSEKAHLPRGCFSHSTIQFKSGLVGVHWVL